MAYTESTPRWFVFRGSELLVRAQPAGPWRILNDEEWLALALPAGPAQRVGTPAGAASWAVEVPKQLETPPGFEFHGLRALWGRLDEETWKLAGRAVQLVDWDRNHRFCGRCGSDTEAAETGAMRSCPQCGLQFFPRLSPAVIVRVEHGDRILLARSPHLPPGMYSTLAGFVEPGESLEETVVREVREEVGIEVKNLRYFGSQPWPFPNSLMIGFVAEYDSGDLRLQPEEIEDAGWFPADNLPHIPPPLSIARALIDEFVAKRTSHGS